MEVIIGIGVPGSGKTTYLKPMADQLGAVYVSADDIREELTGDPTDHSREFDVWKLAYARLNDGLKAGRIVVIDATHTRRRDRRSVIETCRQSGARQISGYYFDTPLQVCLDRNAARQRQVPAVAIEKLYNRLQLNPPELAEGFDSIEVIKDV